MLDTLTDNFIEARTPFLAVSPGVASMIAHRPTKIVLSLSLKTLSVLKERRKNVPWYNIAVSTAAGPITAKMLNPILGPPKNLIRDLHVQTSRRAASIYVGNRPDAKGDNVRTWIDTPGRYKMFIIYHDANKAGPHIDVHIGHVSIIYRVKPELNAQLKFHTDGSLTNGSKELLLQHVRDEVFHGSRVPQNLDHPDNQASYSWLSQEEGPSGYGAGVSRQIVSESEIDIYKAYAEGPIEFYAPVINPGAALYLYQIYPGGPVKDGGAGRAPICIWGEKKHDPPVVEDRLHLKMIDPKNLKKMEDRLDMETSCAKYDGSSVYLEISKKGTTAWSPRISKKTGRRIEYTPKINALAATGTNTTFNETVRCMGELMFWREGKRGTKVWLGHSESGGILNSHSLLPADVHPVIVVYRVDKVGRRTTVGLPFWEQRKLAEDIVGLDPDHLQLPDLMSPQEAKKKGYEGVVICKPGGSILEGYKTKWWTDADDWAIDSVDFTYSEQGNVSGVCWFTSLESGKKFKLGPGGLGNRALCEHMMANPQLYIGSVCKVRSRHGHEGRAAKVEEFHPDKGFAPI